MERLGGERLCLKERPQCLLNRLVTLSGGGGARRWLGGGPICPATPAAAGSHVGCRGVQDGLVMDHRGREELSITGDGGWGSGRGLLALAHG